MERGCIWLIVLVLAGCSSSPQPSLARSSSDPASAGQVGTAPTATSLTTTGPTTADEIDPAGSSPAAPDGGAQAPSGARSSSLPGPSARPGDQDDLVLEAGGVVRVNGRSSLSMGWQQARDAISSALGPPQHVSGVGEVCDTHVMPGFAITWKNFRVLVQSRTSDNEYLGNSRLGRIVGWEVWRPVGQDAGRPVITPPLKVDGGVALGSRLSSMRVAHPEGRLLQGDGDRLWHVGSDLSDDLSFHFTDDAASTRTYFIASGYACGS